MPHTPASSMLQTSVRKGQQSSLSRLQPHPWRLAATYATQAANGVHHA